MNTLTPPVGTRWADTDRDRRTARAVALRRHPGVALRAALARRRGSSERVAPPTDMDDVMERLAALPVSVWTYGFDHPSVRHLGPMAQDFAAAFGLGDDDRRIELVDACGVLMAACKALHRRVAELEHRLDTRERT